MISTDDKALGPHGDQASDVMFNVMFDDMSNDSYMALVVSKSISF